MYRKRILAYTEIIDYKVCINCKYRFRVISGSHILHLPVKSVIVGIKVHYIFDISFKSFHCLFLLSLSYSCIIRDGEHALGLLKNQLRYTREENISCVGGGIYPNMLCAHPPFQIDGNFGFAAAVAEMLIQSRKGHILLLPALPDEWKDGKVGGMKAQGDITVDFEWREGRIHRVRLCSSREQKVTLECNGISKTVFLKPDGTENMIFD